jgi:hypothetical protein
MIQKELPQTIKQEALFYFSIGNTISITGNNFRFGWAG